MVFDNLKSALSGAIMDLKPAKIPDEPVACEFVTLDRDEKDKEDSFSATDCYQWYRNQI